MSYQGNITALAALRFTFNTALNGAPITLAGTPSVAVYKDGGLTESTAGLTLTVDFDGKTGLHLVAVVTSADAAFYAAGHDFTVVLAAGTVSGVSVAGTEVGGFAIQSRVAAPDGDSAGVTTLLSRLSALRAGYLDNLSAGAVALQATLSALNNLSIANVRTAVGLASANLDTQLAAIAGYIDTEVASIIATLAAGMTLTAGERNAVADALLDRANAIETGLTPRGAWRLGAAADAGKTSGMDTGSVLIRNAVADSKNRITAVCDSDGNRTSVTADVT